MIDIQLTDGSWVTSAVTSGKNILPQCPDDTCQWEDFGPPTPSGLVRGIIQLQRCPKCLYTRGRYLHRPEPEPPLTLTGYGEKVHGNEICVLAAPPRQIDLDSREITLLPCARCRKALFVDSGSLSLVEKGAMVSCVDCALKSNPEMIAGRDPDTGQPITLRQIVTHPNWVGVYRREDYQG